jgi:hypothetical protein
MTERSAEKVASIAIGAAVVGAAYYVLRNPHLRQVAWRLGVAALTGTVPAWVTREIRDGWEASGRPAPAARSGIG